jgi:dephospho-CoA kinase
MRIGLTGGIGSGKSAVGRLLAARGALIIDADAIAREIVEPGQPGLAGIIDRFGEGVLTPDGRLDRAGLAAIVFADPEALADLNAITHPLIAQRTAELLAAAPDDAVVVYDMPLLVENGLTEGWDAVVVVDAPDELRIERLVGRGLAEDDARRRMAAQASREVRLAAADHVIDNSGDLDDLDRAVGRLWGALGLGGCPTPDVP